MPRTNAVIAREITSIRRSFAKLATSFRRIGPMLAAATDVKAVPAPRVNADGRPSKRPRLTAAHRAALKLQGRYMGTMRGLPAAKRARVKRIRGEKGIKAAIAAARRMRG